MTPDKLKAWRKERKLSQAEFSDAAGLPSRFTVTRWEVGQADIPANIGEILAKVEAVLGLAHADSPSPAEPAKSRWQHHRWLLKDGTPCADPFIANRYKRGTVFWRLDWADEETGVEHYNLYQAWLDGTLRCTAIRMNAETMVARLDFQVEPAAVRVVEHLNEILRPRQNSEP